MTLNFFAYAPGRPLYVNGAQVLFALCAVGFATLVWAQAPALTGNSMVDEGFQILDAASETRLRASARQFDAAAIRVATGELRGGIGGDEHLGERARTLGDAATVWQASATNSDAVVQPASTGPRAASPTVLLASESGDFDPTLIEYAQRLAIKFQNYSQITGEYRVNADKTISIPVLGRVDVADRTAADLERTLKEQVVRLTGRDTHVTVEVVTYLPVFVTGYVDEAGAYPWQPGMLVINAETLSGGVFRPENSDGQARDSSGRDDRTRVLRFSSELARLHAARARLAAEQTGAEDVAVPSALVELVGASEAERLISAQRAVFRSNNAALRAEVSAVERARVTARRELDGLTRAKERIEGQLEARIQVLGELRGLLRRGLSTRQRVFDEEAQIAQIEERSASIGVSLTRVRGALAGLERQDVELKEERAARVETQLVEIDGQIEALQIDLNSARLTYREQTGRDLVAEQAGRKQVITYEIVRRSTGVPNTFNADRFTPLRPGDILVVNAVYELDETTQ